MKTAHTARRRYNPEGLPDQRELKCDGRAPA
jgi:hypothetical protein